MLVLFNLTFLSYMIILLVICSQETVGDQKGPGISSCDLVATSCGAKPMQVEDFPESCTSFIFSSLQIDETHTVTYTYEDVHNEYLDILRESGKKLYVNFGRDSYTSWIKILNCDGNSALKEAEGINAFISKHPGITGLLLRNLEPDFEDTEEFVGYTESLKKYIEVVKKKTGLEIAFSFHSDDFQTYYDNPQMKWLNFTVLDPCVDFYVFALFTFFNECSEESASDGRKDGVISIAGDYEFTLEKLKNAIVEAHIPTNKTYFNFNLGPQTEDGDICDQTYSMMCDCPDTTKGWCSDTQETMFKKGQWFHENGVGFIGQYIDFEDRQNSCKCGKYPSFNAVLAGFNGTASIPPCPLYDRTC